jgi:hypothetical protein
MAVSRDSMKGSTAVGSKEAPAEACAARDSMKAGSVADGIWARASSRPRR